MFKGFYNLTSAMLTHQHNLNVVGNNLVNVSTAGFKQERYLASTFDEVMYSRVGNKYETGEEIGQQSYIRATSDVYTDHSRGTLEPTGIPLDFAINGEGFFAIRNEAGDIFYTRMGNFSLDEEGYLCLPGYGRVLDPTEQDIYMATDRVGGMMGNYIRYEEGGYLAQLGVFTFEDVDALERNDLGMFIGEGAQAAENPEVFNGFLERSNTDMTQQMTEMITMQRALQSAAAVSRIYDELMSKVTTDIGRMG